MKLCHRSSVSPLLTLLLLLCAGFIRPAAAQQYTPTGPQRYTITDLHPAAAGTNPSQAWGINNNGEVVGDFVNASLYTHAFRWSAGSGAQELAPRSVHDRSFARAINNAGTVAGGSGNSTPLDAVIWRRDNAPVLLKGDMSLAYDINDNEVVVGRSSGNDDDPPGESGSARRYTPGASTTERLLAPSGYLSLHRAFGINNFGQTVGWITASSATHYIAAFWPPSAPATATDLQVLSGSGDAMKGDRSAAYQINDKGLIVGWANPTLANTNRHAFLLIANSMEDLGTLPNRTNSEAYDINIHGHVVGDSYGPNDLNGPRHPFLWTRERGMQDLNTMIPAGSGWTLVSARAINDGGQIVGWGTNASGQTRAYLLTPDPSWTAIAIATGSNNKSVVLWAHTSGAASLNLLSPTLGFESYFNMDANPGWAPVAVGVGGDNKVRLMWRHVSDAVSVNLRTPFAFENTLNYGPNPDRGWSPVTLASGADNKTRVLWSHTSGAASLNLLSPGLAFENFFDYAANQGWTAVSLSVGADGKTRLLWRHVTGAASLNLLSPTLGFEGYYNLPANQGWKPMAIATGADNKTRLLWRHESGAMSLNLFSPSLGFERFTNLPANPGWIPVAIGVGSDNKTRLLWRHDSGVVSINLFSSTLVFEGYINY